MLYHPRILSLVTTTQCTAACEHCCFQCGPKKYERMNFRMIESLITEAASIESIKVVVFTGGECFLLGEDLYAAIALAKSFGMTTRFVSNGYWGATERAVKMRMERLLAAGLDEANFSTGDNHSRYVPPSYVRRAATACADSGLYTSIMIELFKESQFDLQNFIGSGRFSELLDSGRIVLMPSVWMGVSSGSSVTCPPGISLQSAGIKTCSDLFNSITVMPNRRVGVCCGLTQQDIPELSLGVWSPETLQELIDSGKDDLVKAWISVEGPSAILEYCRELDPSIQGAASFGHVCDACRYLYTNEKVARVLKTTPPAFVNDILTMFKNRSLLSAAGPQATRGHVPKNLYSVVRRKWTLKNVQELWDKTKTAI